MKKTRVVLVGYGAMGKNVEELLRGSMDLELCAVVDRLAGPPCLPSFDAVTETFDVIVDFSHPDNLPMLAEYITKHGTPAVLCTTGYSPREDEQVAELAAHAPVLRSRNMSLGVCVMERVVRMVTPILAGFDIEIIERHHNRKIDAPSGTALALAQATESCGDFVEVHGRDGVAPRKKGEIGIHAVRGGTIVGEHEVMFAGEDEVLSIRHSAQSRRLFAAGALRAAQFVAGAPNGLYTMDDALFGGK